MRCPNCGYFSFDYSDRCVKCRTDLTVERGRLNLLEIRPNPLSVKAIMERLPQGGDKKDRQTGVKGAGISKTLNSPSRQGLTLEDPIDLDLELTPQSPKGTKPQKEILELSLEGLEFGPSSEKK